MSLWYVFLAACLMVGIWAIARLANRPVVTHDVEPNRVEDFVRELLEMLVDQSKLIVRLEGAKHCLRLVKHVETDSVTDLHLALDADAWRSLHAPSGVLRRHGIIWQEKAGFSEGERFEIHNIESARRAVDLILLLHGLHRDAPEARFVLQFEGDVEFDLLKRRIKLIRAGKR